MQREAEVIPRAGVVGDITRAATAARSVADATPPEGASHLVQDWHLWAACQGLRRGAEGMVEGKVPSPDR
jgi:hypothetical protein